MAKSSYSTAESNPQKSTQNDSSTRNPILHDFTAHCRAWYAAGRSDHDYDARVLAYVALFDRHRTDVVTRNIWRIKAVLDAAEAGVRDG